MKIFFLREEWIGNSTGSRFSNMTLESPVH